MQAIKPYVVTDVSLTSSNVPENDYAAWASGTTYNLGDRVIVVSVHKIYESASNSNVGNDPTTDDGTNWIEVGATNRWKAFDQRISDPVINPNTIEYTFTTSGDIINSVALFGLAGDTVQITLTPQGGSTVYDQTFDLLDTTNIIDWYTYFFEPATEKLDQILVVDLPAYASATITITIVEDSGGNAQVGQIAMGSLVSIGKTGYGTTIGIEDYSRKERDAFGNPVIIERAFAQKADYEIELDLQDSRRVQRFLSEYRATPVVWVGNTDPSFGLIVYGFYKQFSINLATPTISYTTLEVEGLT